MRLPLKSWAVALRVATESRYRFIMLASMGIELLLLLILVVLEAMGIWHR
jgi:hypothetical protein